MLQDDPSPNRFEATEKFRELRKGGPHPPQQPHPTLPINSPAMSLLLDLRKGGLPIPKGSAGLVRYGQT